MDKTIYTRFTFEHHQLQPEEPMSCNKCNGQLQAWILQSFGLCCFCGNETPDFYRIEDMRKHMIRDILKASQYEESYK